MSPTTYESLPAPGIWKGRRLLKTCLLGTQQDVILAVHKSHVNRNEQQVYSNSVLGGRKDIFFFSCCCLVGYYCYSITMYLHWYRSKYPNSQLLTSILICKGLSVWHTLYQAGFLLFSILNIINQQQLQNSPWGLRYFTAKSQLSEASSALGKNQCHLLLCFLS